MNQVRAQPCMAPQGAHEAYVGMLQALAAQTGQDAAQLLRQQEMVIDGVVLWLSQAATALLCVCEVLRLPAHSSAQLLQLLLQANTLGRPTQGGTLGVLAQSGALVLAKRVPLDAPAAVAARTCRDMAAMSVAWARALSAHLGAGGLSAAAAGFVSGGLAYGTLKGFP